MACTAAQRAGKFPDATGDQDDTGACVHLLLVPTHGKKKI